MKKYLQIAGGAAVVALLATTGFMAQNKASETTTAPPDTNLANLEALSQVAYVEYAPDCCVPWPGEVCVTGSYIYYDSINCKDLYNGI